MAGNPVGDLHPIAEKALRDGGQQHLTDLARRFAAMHYGPEANSWDDRQVLAVSTGHLSDVLADTPNRVALERAPNLISKVLRITWPVELVDYRPAGFETVELDSESPAPSAVELGEWSSFSPTSSAENLQLESVPLRVRFSEQLVVNDDVFALSRTLEAAMVAASQNEPSAAFGLLVSNGNLGDGSALFSAGASNLLTGQSKAASALNNAIEALRNQQINGKNADADPVASIVPSADEATARALVAAVSTAEPWVDVIATSHVTAQWYLMADPMTWPVLVRGTLAGANGEPLRFVPGLPNAKEGSRDLVMKGSHAVAYVPISRVRAVRIEFA